MRKKKKENKKTYFKFAENLPPLFKIIIKFIIICQIIEITTTN